MATCLEVDWHIAGSSFRYTPSRLVALSWSLFSPGGLLPSIRRGTHPNYDTAFFCPPWGGRLTRQGFIAANEKISESFPLVERRSGAKGYGLFCGPRPARCVRSCCQHAFLLYFSSHMPSKKLSVGLCSVARKGEKHFAFHVSEDFYGYSCTMSCWRGRKPVLRTRPPTVISSALPASPPPPRS